MTGLDALVKKAFEGMDKNGFFPQHPCKRCGKMLCGENGPRPAETYAGTYTGLCYSCQAKGPYLVGVWTLDGAQRWSWPPHCPSWRRDRETFTGYPDCEECKGYGATRGWGHWTPIYHYCRPCNDRLNNHPVRKWLWKWDKKVMPAAEERFKRLVIRAAFPKRRKVTMKSFDQAVEKLGEEKVGEIRERCLGDYKRVQGMVYAARERLNPFERGGGG